MEVSQEISILTEKTHGQPIHESYECSVRLITILAASFIGRDNSAVGSPDRILDVSEKTPSPSATARPEK
jgi:hypothetical protein